MNLLNLTDQSLAALGQQVTNESRRRTKAAVAGNDAGTVIWGNEMAKRAVTIAAVGKHSILFVGPSASGKTMLRAACLELGIEESYESRQCPCGSHGDPRAECRCTVRQVEKFAAKYPATDITIQTCRPLERERNQVGTSLADMRAHVSQASRFTDEGLDEHGTNLMKASINELGFDLVTVARILHVARTIANLDRSEQVKPIHLCEAINYRSLGR